MARVYMNENGNVFSTNHPEFHKNAVRMTQAAGKAARKEQCREQLRADIKPGQTVYCIVRHVSASGMSRRIDLLIIEDGRLRNISGTVADAIDSKWSDKGGIVVNGCGMDMCFDLVYRLGAALWPYGTVMPHGTRNGEPDTSGGYALKHETI